ncbi:hypothetical protein [Pedobacter panaciterrae]|uniref:hypothetical protein n=1 Tax=Pedobacter panaciterrae TaxID=363849 RepID=UPI001C20A1BB|nr:hypothetical protein [Pedobacter panaciterrae]
MKKRSLFVMATLFSVCLLIFACRKDIKNIVYDQQISSDMLEMAKIWHQRQTQNAPGEIKLRPLWRDSWSVKSSDGSEQIVVPTMEYDLGNPRYEVKRVFVFSAKGNQIKSGNIFEFVSNSYKVEDNLNNLVLHNNDKSINGFTGSILRYDINYYLTGSSVFENGIKTEKNSEITRNPESMIKNSQISLRSVREKSMGSKGSGIRNTVSVITEYTFNPNCTYLITTSTTCTANGAECKTVIVSITELSCTAPGGGSGSGSGSGWGNGSGSGSGSFSSGIISGGGPIGGNVDVTVVIQSLNTVDLVKLLKCFASISNTGATYKITLHTDIPKNDDPNTDISNFEPGHGFITLTKKNGSTTMSKTFGFYPKDGTGTGILSLSMGAVGSEINDNGGHEYNASISKDITQSAFELALATATTKKDKSYDLNDYNCVDYAVDVYNATRPAAEQISVPNAQLQSGNVTITIGRSPGSLYTKLKTMQTEGKPGIVLEPVTAPKTAPAKTGVCP